MRSICRKCELEGKNGKNFVRAGRFYRRSDAKSVQRFRCLQCRSSFSRATFDICYRQKKRHKNEQLRRLLVSGVSQRRAAEILVLNRTTIVRKFLFLYGNALFNWRTRNFKRAKSRIIEFDDLETFEVTKCKPLSVTLAVESRTRKILGLAVSRMPAKGLLADKARKRYGPRIDERARGRKRLFKEIAPLIHEDAVIVSDCNPHYPADVKNSFPKAKHVTYLGKRGSSGGQGELRNKKFDPMFSLNHTCAMFRANVNRLFRKTWCTTKRSDRLYAHLLIYAQYHNDKIDAKEAARS